MEPYEETCYLWTRSRTVQSQTGTKVTRVRSATDTKSGLSKFTFRPVPCKRVKRNVWRPIQTHTGLKLTMPNIIRKVTRATMIRWYLKFCEEEQYEPLSRASLFRVLKVREAFERPLNQFPTRDSYLNLIIMTSLVTVFLGSRTSYWITLSVSRFLAQGLLGLVLSLVSLTAQS